MLDEVISIVVLDDDPIALRQIADTLRTPRFSIRASFRTVSEACTGITNLKPDIAILDLLLQSDSRHGHTGGLEVLRHIKRYELVTKTIIYTMADGQSDQHDQSYLLECIDAGANGYWLKSTDPILLPEVISTVVKGISVVDRRLLQMVATSTLQSGLFARHEPIANPLTEREIEVLRHVGEGKSNRQIAECLVISEETVRQHVRHVNSKTNQRDRVSAAEYARAKGWLE